MKTRILLALAAGLGLLAGPRSAADWPQFRGPNRDGVSTETGLLQTWPEKGPPLAWTYSDAGIGYSGPAIVGDRVYLMGARDKTEYVFALDARNGQQLWAVKIGPMFDWKGNSWNAGPNATPTVSGGMVFALGGNGELVCTTTDGKEVWRKSMLKDLGGEVNAVGGGEEQLGWGYAWSPLVDGEQLICVPGGKDGLVAALGPKTGAVKWRTKDLAESAPYSSPIVAEVESVRQYLVLTYAGMAGISPKDGKVLWYYKRKGGYPDVLIPTPIYSQGYVFAAAYGTNCDLVQLTRAGDTFQPKLVYSNKNLTNENGGMVLVNGNIYGYSNSRRMWVCLDFKTGKSRWTERGQLSAGSVIAADGELYCYGEDEGIAVLLEASAEAWKEKGRFQIPQKSTLNKTRGKLWTHPVIANGKLYLRDQNLVFCYDIKKK